MGRDQRYSVRLSKQAKKDMDFLLVSELKDKVRSMLDLLAEDPFRSPPPFEKMKGDLKRYYSEGLIPSIGSFMRYFRTTKGNSKG